MFTETEREGREAALTQERLFEVLAESVLELSESQILREVRESGDDPSATAKRTRALMAGLVRSHRVQTPLREAMEAYHQQIAAINAKRYPLPETPEERSRLLATLFQRYPQMHSAFLTIQHRDFKNLSDRDTVSFLRQLQELEVLDEEVWHQSVGAGDCGPQTRHEEEKDDDA